MNYLYAGSFDGQIDSDYWSGGTIDRALGYPRLGCALLADGGSMAQAVGLSADVPYMVHLFYRPETGATLTVSYGAISQAFGTGTVGQWNEALLLLAVDTSANDSLTLSASGGAVRVDSVSLVNRLAISRTGIATALAARLSALATDAGLSSTPSASGPEGDYSPAINEALRALGAIDDWGDPDITALGYRQVNDALEAAQSALLQKLRSTYALETDVSLGPRRENRSQIAASIDAMLSGAGADRRVKVGNLHRTGGWER